MGRVNKCGQPDRRQLGQHRWALALAGLPSLALGLAGSAAAQEPTAEHKAQAAATQTDFAGEIVVTAQKRSQSLQEVPMSISVISESALEAAEVQAFEDYAGFVPNLAFGYGGSSQNDGRNGRGLALRGIAGSGTVGFYIDDTPLPDNIDPKIVDVERIEVLRGPQGTLYGSGSMGGTVRIITRSPDVREWSGKAEAIAAVVKEGGANYDLQGSLNAPIIEDRVAVRAASFYQSDSGIFDRVVETSEGPIVRKNVDEQRIWGAQLGFLVNLTETFTLSPRLMHQHQEADGAPWADTRPANFEQRRLFDNAEPLDDKWTHYALTLNLDAGWGDIVSSTSYLHRDFAESEDQSDFIASSAGFGFPYSSVLTEAMRYRRFIQEVRFVTRPERPLQFTGGAYFSDLKRQRLFDGLTPGFDAAYSAFIGLPAGERVFGTDQTFALNSREKTHEMAVFGELAWNISDRLRATGGLRYFTADQSRLRIAEGIFNGGVTRVAGKTDADGFNPKFRLEFDASDHVLLYTSAAKGYRLGGLNGILPARCNADLAALGVANPREYRPDSLWSYELGTHAETPDRRFSINGALFHIVWSDIQQSQLLAGCGFAFTGNAGRARSNGAEVELTARPLPGFDLSGGIGYTDAEFTGSDPSLSAKVGDRVTQIPKLTFNGTAQYRVSVSGHAEAFARADFKRVGKSFTSFIQDPSEPGFSSLRVRRPYDEVNLALGVELEAVTVSAFVHNVFNQHANLSDTRSIAAELPGRPRYATNRPRTIGVSARTRF